MSEKTITMFYTIKVNGFFFKYQFQTSSLNLILNPNNSISSQRPLKFKFQNPIITKRYQQVKNPPPFIRRFTDRIPLSITQMCGLQRRIYSIDFKCFSISIRALFMGNLLEVAGSIRINFFFFDFLNIWILRGAGIFLEIFLGKLSREFLCPATPKKSRFFKQIFPKCFGKYFARISSYFQCKYFINQIYGSFGFICN